MEEALVAATSELLAESGPRATSVRDIADRAGVNHAQVHHYFGGKRALLKEAMRRMARAHNDALHDITGDRPLPPAMTMPSERYLQAVVRATIEGDIELAGIELSEGGTSMWRGVLDHLTSLAGLTEPNMDVKAALAAGAALQLGWLALEPIILLIADVQPEEKDEIRDRVRRTVYRVQAQVGAETPQEPSPEPVVSDGKHPNGHQPSTAGS